MKRLILISATVLIASSAFAQTKCVTAPVTIKGNQLTLTSSGDKSTTTNKVYVYYSRKHPKRHQHAYAITAIGDKYPSDPIMLRSDKEVSAIPESYNVSLGTPTGNMSVCPDSALTIDATINVEKVGTFTGNYPHSSDNNVYMKVTKREYKMAARKMRKIKRNEARIARRTGTAVEARSGRA